MVNPQCQWGLSLTTRCPLQSDLVIAGICENEHIETYSYCQSHHADWLKWIADGTRWSWHCLTCSKLIIEHESQAYP